MERRYSALRITSTIYKIFGFLVLILTVLGAIGACLTFIAGGALASDLDLPGGGTAAGTLAGIFVAVLILIFGGLSAVSLLGTAELFDLFIALEENTRATRRLMEVSTREATPPSFTPSLTPRPSTPPFAPPPAPGAPLPPTSPGQP